MTNDDIVKRLKEYYGLDKPLNIRYLNWLGVWPKEYNQKLIKFNPGEKSKKFRLAYQDSINIKLGINYKVDLTKLKSNNQKIKFKYRSEFPNGREFWTTEYDYFISANIGFSRIIFDQTKSYGVLNGGYTMGILNGSGYRIFIKKDESGKWIIDKIVGTWIS